MNIHFIAIGGAVMHNLAIVLHRKGHVVTGSDDKIAEPSKTNLEKEGLLPAEIGFFAEKITTDLDAVILGMHARLDNPELVKAQALGIKIYSFPQYIYEVSKNKIRVVVAGSHGKTSITSMIMHVLKDQGKDIDYLVGAKVKGFDTAVKITETASIIILEGDEYLASPLHLESKFLFYQPQIALISGIAWDHINVFPVYENYVLQFKKFVETIGENGFVTYFGEDEELKKIFSENKFICQSESYFEPEYKIENNQTVIIHHGKEFPISVFGKHNLQNIEGARKVCKQLGVCDEDFYSSIQSFEGAANRLQKVGEKEGCVIFKDFAHSPSKLKATVAAMKNQFLSRKLVAVMELHTFSSLNQEFLKEYKNGLREADVACVFVDDEALRLKRMPPLDPAIIKEAFQQEDLIVFTEAKTLQAFLLSLQWQQTNLLLMSSGTFAGLDMIELSNKILNNK